MKLDLEGIKAVATSIRSLSIDAIEKAHSGHPGMPLGAAEVAALIYGEVLKHNPKDSHWINRDRFILSAGHASMLLYSVLHLAGYKVSLEDIKSFRQLGSPCTGHPEWGVCDGVECSSGPLGLGLGISVGVAIAETMMAARYNKPGYEIFNHRTYALCGEGCLEEGVSAEAASLAGTLRLNKLCWIYDANGITIDGDARITFTEDIAKRFEAYGWKVLKGDMYDLKEMMANFQKAKEATAPTLIIAKSTIARYSPLEGSSASHGSPLGAEAVRATKKTLGLPEDKDFSVLPEAYAYFNNKKDLWQQGEDEWNALFAKWGEEYPELKKEVEMAGAGVAFDLPLYELGSLVSTRKASEDAINAIAAVYPLVGGSADLKGSNKTAMKGDLGTYQANNLQGRTIEYGVRELGMGCVAMGLALSGVRNFCATYLVFSDYLKAAIRLCSMQKLPVIFIFTHDSIFVGEDGPSHQPIEQLEGLRLIPGLKVLRPGDAQETLLSWQMAWENTKGPTALILTRQNIKVYEKDSGWESKAKCGAYIVKDEKDAKVTVLASGSEVNMALEAAKEAKCAVRVVSVIDKSAIERDRDLREKLCAGRTIALEAGVGTGWKWCDRVASIDEFGLSAPGAIVAKELGFTKEALLSIIDGI